MVSAANDKQHREPVVEVHNLTNRFGAQVVHGT